MSPRTKEQFEEIRKQSKRKIVFTAMELVAQNGYQGITIDKISKKAGISKGLIYNYFKNKDELFDYIIFQTFKEIEDSMKMEDKYNNPKEQLKSFIETIFRSLKDNLVLWKLYTQILLLPEASEKFAGILDSFNSIFIPIFSGLFPDLTNEELELELMFFGSFLDGIIFDYVVMPKFYPLEKIKNRLIKKYCLEEK